VLVLVLRFCVEVNILNVSPIFSQLKALFIMRGRFDGCGSVDDKRISKQRTSS